MILVVVAHPDDESLWFGGTLMKLSAKGHVVGIVSVTNAGNDVRSREFMAVCERLGAQGVMLDLPDRGDLLLPDFGPALDSLLHQSNMTAADLECIITHAPHGNERSHLQHLCCHHHVLKWSRDRSVAFASFSEIDPFDMPAPAQGEAGLYRIERPWIVDLGGYKTVLFVVAGICISVDPAEKQALFELYPSQVGGLHQYVTSGKDLEYVFFQDADAATTFYGKI